VHDVVACLRSVFNSQALLLLSSMQTLLDLGGYIDVDSESIETPPIVWVSFDESSRWMWSANQMH